jgi:hypothetical protein
MRKILLTSLATALAASLTLLSTMTGQAASTPPAGWFTVHGTVTGAPGRSVSGSTSGPQRP